MRKLNAVGKASWALTFLIISFGAGYVTSMGVEVPRPVNSERGIRIEAQDGFADIATYYVISKEPELYNGLPDEVSVEVMGCPAGIDNGPIGFAVRGDYPLWEAVSEGDYVVLDVEYIITLGGRQFRMRRWAPIEQHQEDTGGT